MVLLDAYGNPIDTTTSTAETTPKEDTKNGTKEEEEALFIQTPIFILFAEYLGYVSDFLDIAENWCNPTKPMPKQYMITLLEREARAIYDRMLEDFSEDEIHSLYVHYLPCGLDELNEDLKEKRTEAGDDLPF